MPVVVDASALIAVMFGEPEKAAVKARLPPEGLESTLLLPFEVANAAVQKVRRGRVTAGEADAAMAIFLAMPIDLHAVPADALVLLAQESGLTAYDAGYLWLARELKADLVTLDAELETAWLKDKADDGEANPDN